MPKKVRKNFSDKTRSMHTYFLILQERKEQDFRLVPILIYFQIGNLYFETIIVDIYGKIPFFATIIPKIKIENFQVYENIQNDN